MPAAGAGWSYPPPSPIKVDVEQKANETPVNDDAGTVPSITPEEVKAVTDLISEIKQTITVTNIPKKQ